MDDIDRFEDEYAFLSNFYPSLILVDGLLFPTVEHAFQAAKTRFMEEKVDIRDALTPAKAKRLGRKCCLRADWQSVKREVMLDCLRLKFNITDLRDKLLATGDATLVEGNTWHDNYWGVCMCPNCLHKPKRNVLGYFLMQVREEASKKNKEALDAELKCTTSITLNR